MAPIKEWFGVYNVIFNWFENRHGYNALESYWRFLVDSCFENVIMKIKVEGLKGIEEYFENTFRIDEGEFRSQLEEDKLIFEVLKCPDYKFMKSSTNPNFVPNVHYCKHHEVMNHLLAEKSGYRFYMQECSMDGTCKWVFE